MLTKFTNCLLVKDNSLVREDLWFSSLTGTILDGQDVFYSRKAVPDRLIDLGGRIVSPGFIDVQFNGGYGFDFSKIPPGGIQEYANGILRLNQQLIKTGVTSYCPTLTSQAPIVYQKVCWSVCFKFCGMHSNMSQVLPLLGPQAHHGTSKSISESLGAHVEGPLLSSHQNGCHSQSVLQVPGVKPITQIYGLKNFIGGCPIKLLTLAPELPGACDLIQSATSEYGIAVSIGHSEATYEEAQAAMRAGATMITHLFNAMTPMHHRNPGIMGLLGAPPTKPSYSRPYFGIISDGFHLHPTSVKIAWHSHPEGLILVSDAMKFLGMPDGTYEWTNGSKIIKKGDFLTLEENGKLAGSAVSLVDCVSNFLNWTGATVPEALRAVTETPAKMLKVDDRKGFLRPGAEADLVVLELEEDHDGQRQFAVHQVWKLGEKAFEAGEANEMSWKTIETP
jgi:N-acetylglucosamine-6-phosphate deacetylase